MAECRKRVGVCIDLTTLCHAHDKISYFGGFTDINTYCDWVSISVTLFSVVVLVKAKQSQN